MTRPIEPRPRTSEYEWEVASIAALLHDEAGARGSDSTATEGANPYAGITNYPTPGDNESATEGVAPSVEDVAAALAEAGIVVENVASMGNAEQYLLDMETARKLHARLFGDTRERKPSIDVALAAVEAVLPQGWDLLVGSTDDGEGNGWWATASSPRDRTSSMIGTGSYTIVSTSKEGVLCDSAVDALNDLYRRLIEADRQEGAET